MYYELIIIKSRSLLSSYKVTAVLLTVFSMLYITSQWLTYFTTRPQFFISLEVLCCCFHIWRGVTTSGPCWLTSGEKHPLWAVLGILRSLLWGCLLHTSSCGRILKHTYLLWILQSLAECWQNPFAFSRGILNGPAGVFSRACRLRQLSAQAPLLPECVLTAVSACTGKQGDIRWMLSKRRGVEARKRF